MGAAVVLAMLAGVAPASAWAASGPDAPAAPALLADPSPDEHVNLLDLDDLLDDLLYALGLRDHGSNDTSLLDVLGLTGDEGDEKGEDQGGDQGEDQGEDQGDAPAPAPPAQPTAPEAPDLMAIVTPPAEPGGEAPGSGAPDLMAIVTPPAEPGGEAPGAPTGPDQPLGVSDLTVPDPAAPGLPGAPPAG
jgi:hypothetical protein